MTFTPDSKELVFVSNREGNDKEAWTTNNDVWSVPVAGGTAKKLTPNPAADVQPTFTPDGKFMIVRAQRRPQLRVRSLVSRRLRSRDGHEAHRVRDARSVGQ